MPGSRLFVKPIATSLRCGRCSTSTARLRSIQTWLQPQPNTGIPDDEINRLASLPRRPLTLADLVKHGRPPLSKEALLSSANFTLSLLPARLAHRVRSLRNLPFIVVSNPYISTIYNNYLRSLSALQPFYKRRIDTLEDEKKFTAVMADLVNTHANTIPILARGFMECRKYISPTDVTRFLDQHLRARIGTRLIAEQHIALHMASQPEGRASISDSNNYIGVIDTALRPAETVRSCESFVAEICELKYGIRPSVVINGQPDAEFTHVPLHLEYVITELLKNAFRATIESGNEREPIEVTIAAAPDVAQTKLEALRHISLNDDTTYDFSEDGLAEYCSTSKDVLGPLNTSAPSITLRIRDRGGGIAPEILPNIWSYSFTTFENGEASVVDNGNTDALNTISGGSVNPSSIAGLGYGLPLGRAYAEYFGGSIAIKSMYGWGTDLYLSLQGIGSIE